MNAFHGDVQNKLFMHSDLLGFILKVEDVKKHVIMMTLFEIMAMFLI